MKDRQRAPGYWKTNGNATDLRHKAQDFGVNKMVLHLKKKKKQTLFRPTIGIVSSHTNEYAYFPVAINECYPYRFEMLSIETKKMY